MGKKMDPALKKATWSGGGFAIGFAVGYIFLDGIVSAIILGIALALAMSITADYEASSRDDKK